MNPSTRARISTLTGASVWATYSTYCGMVFWITGVTVTAAPTGLSVFVSEPPQAKTEQTSDIAPTNKRTFLGRRTKAISDWFFIEGIKRYKKKRKDQFFSPKFSKNLFA